MGTPTPPGDRADIRWLASRAATLRERLAAPESPHPPRLDGHAVLRAWRAAIAAPDDGRLSAHLHWYGLTIDDATRRAARALHLEGPLPPWTNWLAPVATAAADLARDGGVHLDTLTWPRADGIAEPPFVELLLPWLIVARHVLGASASPQTWPLPLEALEAQFLRECGTFAGQALLHDFRTWTADASNSGGYRGFVLATLADGVAGVFARYPVLARQLSTVAEDWCAATDELGNRLHLDRPELERVFNGGSPAGAVVGVEPGLSDPHEGRRRVVILRFASGLRVVYKPRDVSIDVAVTALADWARREGHTLGPRTSPIVARDTYGWFAAAEQAGSWTAADARTYFERAGGLLCWAHVLRLRDLHVENIIASADGPVAIDLEATAQPATSGDGDTSDSLVSGLLSVIQIREDDGVADVGGLAGSPESAAISRVRVWRHLRTADIAVTEEVAGAPHLANGVVVNGRRVSPYDEGAAILAGFEAAYRFVLAHRDALLAAGGPLDGLARAHVRIVPRHTDQYAAVLQALTKPEYLTDGAVRSAWLHVLARPHAGPVEPPPIWPLLLAEQDALERLDVPRFWMEADGTTLYTAAGVVAPGHTSRSGLDAVRQTIARLSDDDLRRRSRSLARALADDPRARFEMAVPPPPEAEGSPQDFIDAALALAAAIDTRRVPVTDTPNLYEGPVGHTMFLAALARVTQDRRWQDRANATLDTHLAAARAGASASEGSLGICSGWGSLLYSLVRLADLLDRPDLLAGARATALEGGARAGDARAGVDLADGQAGLLLALLAIHARTGDDDVLALAEACGAALERAERTGPSGSYWPTNDGRAFVGFAHGAAGIATAARGLAAAVRRDHHRWSTLGERAWETVAGAALGHSGRWPVELGTGPGGASMTAWCHGAPGILIGAARTLDFGGESAILAHATAAVTALQHAPDHAAEHVCCGNLGRAEALLVFGLRTGDAGFVSAARAVGRRTIARASARQHVRLAADGFRYPIFDAGFFRGLSGVGYEWLRLAAPAVVPSVLGFE